MKLTYITGENIPDWENKLPAQRGKALLMLWFMSDKAPEQVQEMSVAAKHVVARCCLSV